MCISGTHDDTYHGAACYDVKCFEDGKTWLESKNLISEQTKQYKKNVQDGKISFGKYKGFSVKELSGLEKGLDYLGWLLKQQWFSEDKFGSLYDAIRNDTNLLPKKTSKKT